MTKNWLALLLVAAVPLWAVGCGGGTEEPEGGGGSTTETTEDGHSHDGEGHDAGEGTTEEGTTEDGTTEEGTTGNGGNEGGETSTASADSAEGTVLAAVEAMKSEEPGKLWAMMPASYQKDVNDVVHGYAAKMPEEAWTKTFALVGKSLDTLKAKKEMVLAHPLVGFSGIDVEEVAKSYDGTIDVLASVVKSDLADLEKLRTADVGELVASIGGQVQSEISKIAPTLPGGADAMADMQKSLNSVKVKTIEETADTAKLEITSTSKTLEFKDDEFVESWEEKTEEVEFVKVEGKWIPADMQKEFKTGIEQAKQTLENLPQEQVDQIAQMVLTQVEAVEPLVDGLAAAENQAEFNAAVDKVMQFVQQMQGPPGGPEPGFPAPPEESEEASE